MLQQIGQLWYVRLKQDITNQSIKLSDKGVKGYFCNRDPSTLTIFNNLKVILEQDWGH